MSRRALGVATLATGLVATGLLPFLGVASAAACPTWTDPAGDASAGGFTGTQDAGLDIVRTTVSTAGTDLVVAVKAAKLSASYSGYGDEFAMNLTVGGQRLLVYSDRSALGIEAGVFNAGDDSKPIGAATATYDVASSTVTIKVPRASLDATAGLATTGQTATALATSTALQVLAFPFPSYDTSSAGTAVSYVLGTACTVDGGTAPTASPTATATASPTASPTAPPTASPTNGPGLPEGYPQADCNTFSDPKGDGGVDAPLSNAGAPVAEGPNDPDLDLTGLALNTTDTDVIAFLRVSDLKAMPANGNGHQFDVSFTHNAKVINLYTQQVDTVVQTQRNLINGTGVLASNPPVNTGGKVGGTYNKDLKVTATYDVTNNFVILKLTRASLESVAGKEAPDGTTVTAVAGASRMVLPNGGFNTADIVQAATPATQVYTFGDSPCFGPPAATLANTGKTSAQFTDAAAVAAKLTSGTGAALSGKAVTFTIGGKSVTATTGSDGVAKAALPHGLTAGSYSLVTAFDGDATAGKASLTTPFTVVQEKTKLVLGVVKSGTRRTVTAKLLDDDGKPVAGQVVTWYVNGKKVSAPKTNSSGVVTLTTAKPTQTVKAVFTAVAGKYLGSTAQTKV